MRLVFVVERDPESEAMFPVAVLRLRMRVLIFPVAVAILLLMMERDPERASCARGIVK